MQSDKFAFSGHPNYLEWYKCYDDPCNDSLEDGNELLERKQKWDERAIAKWRFFYRPFLPAVGRPQKKMINERRSKIDSSLEKTTEEERKIAEQREEIRKASNILFVWLGVSSAPLVWLLTTHYWQAIILPLVVIGIAFQGFWRRRSNALAAIYASQRKIEIERKAIDKNESDIRILNDEIDHLRSQIPSPVTADVIKEWLNQEIQEMECFCLSQFTREKITKDNIVKYISRDFGDDRVKGILVDSWGALQPVSLDGPLGREANGLGRVFSDLHSHSFTWRIGTDALPVFRVLFFQFIFPLERSLDICTFFYDFVTRKSYGNRAETFHYNHITNLSIREVDPDLEPWVGEHGLYTMSRLLKGKTLRAFTITAAGGSHFRCVLVGEDVADVLNEMLRREEKYHDLLDKSGDSLEEAKIEALVKEAIENSPEIEFKTRSAQAVFAHVRDCIQEYVYQFRDRERAFEQPGLDHQ
jgi:hypothetical protein